MRCGWKTLLKVYPDARLIWNHRDPFTATGSFCSLIALGHRTFAGKVDHAWIGQNCAFQAAEHVNRIMEARDRLGEGRIIVVQYADLINNPIGTMRNLYRALGDEFTPAAEAAMQAWIDDNPQNRSSAATTIGWRNSAWAWINSRRCLNAIFPVTMWLSEG